MRSRILFKTHPEKNKLVYRVQVWVWNSTNWFDSGWYDVNHCGDICEDEQMTMNRADAVRLKERMEGKKKKKEKWHVLNTDDDDNFDVMG